MRRALLLISLAATPAFAQGPLSADTPVFALPNGASIGTLKRGATVKLGASASGWTAVTLEGWVNSPRLVVRKDTLDRTVAGQGVVSVRTSDGATQPLVAELEVGAALKRLSDRNGWTQVRRTGWIRSAAEKPRAADSTVPTVQTGEASPQRIVRSTGLRTSPGGEERATVRPGTTVQELARQNGWARVRIEGWIPERDLMVADSSNEVGLSAADVRADPVAHKGKVVRWRVQVVSVQKADPLRRSLGAEEYYLLARGPAEEGAILYVALPRAQIDQIRALPQLSNIMITARVRDGRSPPVGAPLLDLISFTKVP